MVLDYTEEINKVVAKYAFDKDSDIQDDLRQECYLSLLEAGDKINNKGTAYIAAKNCVLNILRKEQGDKKQGIKAYNPGKVGGPGKSSPEEKPTVEYVSLADPSVMRTAEIQKYVVPELEFLDIEKILDSLKILSWSEQAVIRSVFGINCDKKTRKEIADAFTKTAKWVRWKEISAKQKIRNYLKIDVRNK
jgi:DNA-directed RNA polymerase specialized sigma24 family protein